MREKDTDESQRAVGMPRLIRAKKQGKHWGEGAGGGVGSSDHGLRRGPPVDSASWAGNQGDHVYKETKNKVPALVHS